MVESIYDRINDYGSVKIGLASPNDIRSWSFGEVRKPETINYRTYRPEKDGLFCERIFGPERDWECACGKYKGTKFKGIICDRCGVKVTHSRVRRKRMGHINLAAPIVHIWFFKAMPSRLANILDMKTTAMEKIVYFQDYVVTDPGPTPLKARQSLSEEDYRRAVETYGDTFTAEMGAEAVRSLLGAIDLDSEVVKLRQDLDKTNSQQKIKEISKRLRIIESLRKSDNDPKWMVMDVIPVIPPDLRPLVLLESGNFATSDLNDLYRRIINRNNRLKKLVDLNAPEVIIRNEKRMLQQAADALFDNGRCRRPVLGSSNRPLKSLTDMIKGKQGRFRENLLGKRVDYSARSVIVVGPELKLYQCGLPKKIALELYQPFIIRQLKDRGLADTIKSAKKMLERKEDCVWDVLEEVIREHPVLLNRAPTLHRMGIQAFEPVLIEGNAIHLHPLVCRGFNADFDGDQMAVHLPLSVEAQIEAHVLMMSNCNIFSPANSSPIMSPSQDIVLGNYYITIERPCEKGEGMIFSSPFEAMLAYDQGKVSLQAGVKVRLNPGVRAVDGDGNYSEPGVILKTTVGRCIFNDAMAEEMPFYNFALGSKGLSGVISDCFRLAGRSKTIDLLDTIKELGFKYATLAGISISVTDLRIPSKKQEIIDATQKKVNRIEKNFKAGALTEGERKNQVIDAWTHARVEVTNEMMRELESDERDGKPYLNPVFLMTESGARGRVDQIQQLAGMRALMAKPSGEIIETPIRSNFREGLNVLEYFSSTHGARKGLADTALKTADSGYLTRKLADVCQNVIVNERNCGTLQGINKSAVYQGEEVSIPLHNVIVGRIARDSIRNPITDEIIVSENEVITAEIARKIEDLGLDTIRVRSPMTCESPLGVCATCYGVDLSTGWLVEEGMAVGILAAQSIGEPGTQLTMRTFHTGGIAERAVMEHQTRATVEGTVKYFELNAVDVITEDVVADEKDISQESTKEQSSTERTKSDVAKDKSEEDTITKWMEENLECLAIPFEESEDKIQEYEEIFRSHLKPKREKETPLKTVLGFIADRLMHEYKDDTNPKKGPAPFYNRDFPKDDEKTIKDIWQSKVPKSLVDFYNNTLQSLKDKEWSVGCENAPPSSGICFFREKGKIVYVGIAGEGRLKKRIREHLYGNVMASSFRLHIKKHVALKRNGEIIILDAKDRELERYRVPYGASIMVGEGELVKVGKVLFEWDPHSMPILSEASGIIRFQDIEEGETIRTETETGKIQRSVVIEHKGEKHPRIVIEDEEGRILDFHYLPAKARIQVDEGDRISAGALLALQPRAIAGTQDITGGLPRVTEVFEARKPRDPATMAEISGQVELRSDKRRGKMTITVRSESGLEIDHHVLHDKHLLVHSGDYVDAGDPLVDGPLIPHDILRIRGEEALQQYLLVEIQHVYQAQKQNINDKHIEIVVSQMLRKVKVENVGDTNLLPGDIVDKFTFRRENERLAGSVRIADKGDSELKEGQVISKEELARINEPIVAIGGDPAEGKKCRPASATTMLLGITKASLSSESFVSAASFQETTRVLTEASISGKVDQLLGLKENVILGHLIPAGTAFKPYLTLKIKHTAKPPTPIELESDEFTERQAEDARAEQAVKEALGLTD